MDFTFDVYLLVLLSSDSGAAQLVFVTLGRHRDIHDRVTEVYEVCQEHS